MPKFPDCWESCGNCGQSEVIIDAVLVQVGDRIRADDGILTLETGKVALDIPSPKDGRVVEVFFEEGDMVTEGQLLITLDTADGP